MSQKYSYQRVAISLASLITNRRYELAGQRITHNNGTKPVSIKLHSNTFDSIDLQPQGSVIVPEGFNQFFLSADAAAGQTVELIVSSPANMEFDNKALTVDVIDNIINLESVDLIDDITQLSLLKKETARYDDTLNDQNTFFGSGILGASASNYGYFSLFNPASSGKLLILEAIGGKLASGDSFYVRTTTTGMTTDQYAFNKYIGGSSNTGQFRADNISSASGTVIGRFPISSEPFEFNFKQKVVIPEGVGIMLSNPVVSNTTFFWMEWKEIDI